MKRLGIFLLVLFSTVWLCSSASGTIIVGRITHVEGQIYRYLDVDRSWVETFLDSPAGTQDFLTTGAGSRAEIHFPNNLLVRLDANAEIEILQLREDEGKFTLQNGLARFYNQSTTGSLLIGTERGTAVVEPGSVVDLLVAGKVVAVSAVYGQAIFLSVENGIEKQEVISGSTRLEFRQKSIVAGAGPLDRNWDGWCADRENVWTQNRMVRSEYLPETMQEYAYVIEPYGSWRRIYYRGYYYWAWQPNRVAVGWAPYTTGYWYDWRDEPVWIDYNPWGWVTHHHGHWLHLQGAWLWTPYVHVSHVPGITVVGFNIHFGRKYRPYWHPGRVRWISQTSHIGWLPLAPRETYYGYHRWGPGSEVVPAGVNFSININLADHRYIDSAVIVPRKGFQRQRPVALNHYNTVRVREPNKTIIARNYKPIPTLEKQKFRKNITQARMPNRILTRSAMPPERKKIKRQEASRSMRNLQKETPRIHVQKKEQKGQMFYKSRRPTEHKQPESLRKNRNFAGQERNIPSVLVRPEPSNVAKQNETLKKTAAGANINKERPGPTKNIVKTSRERMKDSREVPIDNSKRVPKIEREANRSAVQPDRRRKTEKEVLVQTRVNNRNVPPNKVRPPRTSKEIPEKAAANRRKEEAKKNNLETGRPQDINQKRPYWESYQNRQRPGGGNATASSTYRQIR